MIYKITTGDNINYELPTIYTSKYFSTQELAKLKIPNQFNIFNTNINGSENKFEILHEFITNASNDFDIIGLTETSQKCSENFTNNVSINNYNPNLLLNQKVDESVAAHS